MSTTQSRRKPAGGATAAKPSDATAAQNGQTDNDLIAEQLSIGWQLDRIAALVERWEKADYRAELGQAVLAAKLSAIYAHVARIPKNGRNEHFNYRFAQESDVSDAIRPLLSQFRVAVFPSTTFEARTAAKTGRGKDTALTDVLVAFTWVCGDTGAERTVTQPGTGDDPSDKGTSKATTSAVKYALMKGFLLATGDDPDEQHAGADPAASGGQRAPAAGPRRASPAPAAGGEGSGLVTPEQRRKLMALAGELGLSIADTRRVVAVSSGVLSTKLIPKKLFNQVLTDLNGFAQNPAAGQAVIDEWRKEQPALARELEAKIAAEMVELPPDPPEQTPGDEPTPFDGDPPQQGADNPEGIA